MASVALRLDTSRQALLDLSTRNRLISTPLKSKSAKIVEVEYEQAVEIIRVLERGRR